MPEFSFDQNLLQVRAATKVVELVCQSGLDIPVNFFDSLLHACERSCELDMVYSEPFILPILL